MRRILLIALGLVAACEETEPPKKTNPSSPSTSRRADADRLVEKYRKRAGRPAEAGVKLPDGATLAPVFPKAVLDQKLSWTRTGGKGVHYVSWMAMYKRGLTIQIQVYDSELRAQSERPTDEATVQQLVTKIDRQLRRPKSKTVVGGRVITGQNDRGGVGVLRARRGRRCFHIQGLGDAAALENAYKGIDHAMLKRIVDDAAK